MVLNKTKVINSKTERIRLIGSTSKTSHSFFPENVQSPLRRQTYTLNDKENLPTLEMNVFPHDSLSSPKHFQQQDDIFVDNFNIQNQNKNNTLMSDDSLDGSIKLIGTYNSPFKDFCLTPLKSTENLLSPFNATNKSKRLNNINDNFAFTSFNTSPFKPIDTSTAAKMYSPDERKPTSVSVNLYSKFGETTKNESIGGSATFVKDTNTDPFLSPPSVEQSFDSKQVHQWSSARITLHHSGKDL